MAWIFDISWKLFYQWSHNGIKVGRDIWSGTIASRDNRASRVAWLVDLRQHVEFWSSGMIDAEISRFRRQIARGYQIVSLQNRKSFEYFLCFQRTLGISPTKIWRDSKLISLSFTRRSLARWRFELWIGAFHMTSLKFKIQNYWSLWYVTFRRWRTRWTTLPLNQQAPLMTIKSLSDWSQNNLLGYHHPVNSPP